MLDENNSLGCGYGSRHVGRDKEGGRRERRVSDYECPSRARFSVSGILFNILAARERAVESNVKCLSSFIWEETRADSACAREERTEFRTARMRFHWIPSPERVEQIRERSWFILKIERIEHGFSANKEQRRCIACFARADVAVV